MLIKWNNAIAGESNDTVSTLTLAGNFVALLEGYCPRKSLRSQLVAVIASIKSKTAKMTNAQGIAMRKPSRILPHLAIASLATVWSLQATAQDDDKTYKQLRQDVKDLQLQIEQLQKQSRRDEPNSKTVSDLKKQNETLTIGGGVVTEYQVRDYTENQEQGGGLILDYFMLTVDGKLDNGISYAADYRWSDVNFADGQYLHYGWAAYDFGVNDEQQVKGGFFRVPFGNLPYGYQTFWGSLNFYAGFADHQAAGLNYKYESGPLRIDAGFFKNDTLSQSTTYSGGVPVDGYANVNGGNLRVAYTLRQTKKNYMTVSISGQGGQLETGSRDIGSRWAGSLALDAHAGPWTGQLQMVSYAYNVPDNATSEFGGGFTLPTDSITVQDYGFRYQLPARAEIYSANIAHDFNVNWGPVTQVQLYNNYGYLKVGGNGQYNSAAPSDPVNITKDTQFNALGALFVAGPIYVWADLFSGKNSAMTFVGPNDDQWHTRFNLTTAFYFGGNLKK